MGVRQTTDEKIILEGQELSTGHVKSNTTLQGLAAVPQKSSDSHSQKAASF